MANPNGDPDENRPRIDPYSGKNLVTEYRLKRTIRDYLKTQGKGIFIREDLNSDGSRKTIEVLAEPYITENKKTKAVDKDKLIKEHIDVRLFGLMFLVKDISFKSIGPMQFSIGQSLNKVQEIEIRNTRVVPTKEDAKAGTFGHKNILRYSFILFHGFLNQLPAREVNLSEEDVNDMMLAMWHGTNNLSTTSKFGQTSRLLVRIVYANDKAYIGNMDRGVTASKTEAVEDISEVGLGIDKLLTMIAGNKQHIAEVQYAIHDDVTLNDATSVKKHLVDWLSKHSIKHKDILAG
jgi:CRISPR-associated protein Csh2